MKEAIVITDQEKQQLQQLRGKLSERQLVEWFLTTTGKTLSRSALQRRFQKWDEEKKKDLVGIPEQVRFDRTVESLKAESNYYKKLYQTATKENASFDRIIEAVRETSVAIPAVPLLIGREPVRAESIQTVVSPLCDTHIGEYVDYNQMLGINQYSIDIFNQRLYGWAHRVIDLVELRRKYAQIPQLVVPMLGDMVSGNLHDLAGTNLDNNMNQMARGAHMIAQSLVFLSQYFEEVRVPCVVGNHGRMTEKPPSKDKYVDWDYLLFQWTAAFCKNQPNIKFEIPKSFLHVFEASGKKILMLHGDSIRSWQAIPFYGISRAVAQIRQILQIKAGLEEDLQNLPPNTPSRGIIQVLSSYFDAIILGHFHTHDELDMGTGPAIICGGMMGGNEYSFGKLHSYSKPKQILTFWHPKYGYLGKDIIYLDRYNNTTTEKFVDVLPNVWADTNY